MDTPGDYRELGFSGTEGAGVAGNGSLVISRVSRDHAGFYLCQASNGIGPGLSKLIRLTVHGKIFTQHTSYEPGRWISVSARELGIPDTSASFRNSSVPWPNILHAYIQGERLYLRRGEGWLQSISVYRENIALRISLRGFSTSDAVYHASSIQVYSVDRNFENFCTFMCSVRNVTTRYTRVDAE